MLILIVLRPAPHPPPDPSIPRSAGLRAGLLEGEEDKGFPPLSKAESGWAGANVLFFVALAFIADGRATPPIPAALARQRGENEGVTY